MKVYMVHAVERVDRDDDLSVNIVGIYTNESRAIERAKKLFNDLTVVNSMDPDRVYQVGVVEYVLDSDNVPAPVTVYHDAIGFEES